MKVVSVKFKENGRAYYFDPGEFKIKEGDFVVVTTARGTECGEVVLMRCRASPARSSRSSAWRMPWTCAVCARTAPMCSRRTISVSSALPPTT